MKDLVHTLSVGYVGYSLAALMSHDIQWMNNMATTMEMSQDAATFTSWMMIGMFSLVAFAIWLILYLFFRSWTWAVMAVLGTLMLYQATQPVTTTIGIF